MEIKHTDLITVKIDLEVGEKITIKEGLHRKVDGIESIIEDIKYAPGKCASGFMVKINTYFHYIDSGWIVKQQLDK